MVSSDDYGRDLTGVQNLKKKHKRLENELASHEPAIQGVIDKGHQLQASGQMGGPEIQQRLRQMEQTWSDLKGMSSNR